MPPKCRGAHLVNVCFPPIADIGGGMRSLVMSGTPPHIRWFETLQIIAIAVGLIRSFAVEPNSIGGPIVDAVILTALTFAVSRGRKNWARWLLTAMFAAGVVLMFWAGIVLHPITIAVTVAQAIAVALLFTRQSETWMHPPPHRLESEGQLSEKSQTAAPE